MCRTCLWFFFLEFIKKLNKNETCHPHKMRRSFEMDCSIFSKVDYNMTWEKVFGVVDYIYCFVVRYIKPGPCRMLLLLSLLLLVTVVVLYIVVYFSEFNMGELIKLIANTSDLCLFSCVKSWVTVFDVISALPQKCSLILLSPAKSTCCFTSLITECSIFFWKNKLF